MIKCRECGHTAEKFQLFCPKCNAKYSFSRLEIEDALDEARITIKKKDYAYGEEIYKALSDMGITEAEREYAALLENGTLGSKDLDGAMKYYFCAAKKNDPVSAYRYSRLAARTSDKASQFWLTYSALLGCREAFCRAAEHYEDIADLESAVYYYALAAHSDDTSAIVTMARKYYEGSGVEKNDSYAKWYMDKLTMPPLYALKLALKLRSAVAKMPPEPQFTSKSRVIRSLIRDAKKYSLDGAHLFLSELLAKGGGADALYSLGVLYAEGAAGDRTDDAIALLRLASEKGSAEASRYLGDMYAQGKIVERSIKTAIEYYKHSAGLGEGAAYGIMGDMFAEGKVVEKNLAYAIELYSLGMREGDAGCRAKAQALTEKREEFFKKAKSLENQDPAAAFRFCAESCAMGYLPAHKELARMFERGSGTKKDRKMAFTWYTLAVKGGDTDAFFDLGRCYAYGIGTAFDFELALDSFSKAKRYGNLGADGEILRLLNNKKKSMVRSLFSKGVKLIYNKKFEDAFELLHASAEIGYPEGCYVVGCMYEFGLGVPTSRTNAFEFYNRAFDLGFRDPRQLYKLRILKMAR